MADAGVKKLVLSKETVRELTESDLERVAGGATTNCILCEPTGCTNPITGGIACPNSWCGC